MTVTYPSLKQCEGSNRQEVTEILSDVSDSGVVRGRAMHSAPTYRLTLRHELLSRAEFDSWEAFWNANFDQDMRVTWAVDGEDYEGVPGDPPTVEYIFGGWFTVTTNLLCKRV